jgi:hypothetical protein
MCLCDARFGRYAIAIEKTIIIIITIIEKIPGSLYFTCAWGPLSNRMVEVSTFFKVTDNESCQFLVLVCEWFGFCGWSNLGFV